jgi:hypothetical protein
MVRVKQKRQMTARLISSPKRVTSDSFSYLLALLLVAVAIFVALICTSLGFTESWPFGLFMFPVLYVTGKSLAELVYRGDMKPVTIISFALIFWYFGPLSVLTLGVPGFGISLSAAELISPSILVAVALLIAAPVVFVEESFSFSYLKGLSRVPLATLAACVALITVLQVALIASGAWTYGSLLLAGTRSDDSGGTAALQLANYLAVINLPLAAHVLGLRAGQKKSLSLIGVIAAAALLSGVAWHFIGGRRYLTVEVLVAAAFYLKAREAASGRSVQLGAVAKTASLLICLVAVSWPTYFAVRVASQSVKEGQAMPSAAELLGSAVALDSSSLSQGYSNQVIDRSAIINSVAAVAPALKRFALGDGLWYSVRIAAPSQLVDKSHLAPSIEGLWTSYGIKLDDYSNSLILDSYVDFGVVGFVLYALLVMSSFALSAVALSRFPLASAVIQIGFLFQFLNGENTITSYLAFARNGLLLSIPFIVFGFLAPRRVRAS